MRFPRPWPAAVLALAAACAAPGAPAAAPGARSGDAYAVYDAVVPRLDSLVEAAWGRPRVNGRTTVRLGRHLLPPRFTPPSTGAPALVDTAWAREWRRRGDIADLCPEHGRDCPQGEHTMVVGLSRIAWMGPDTALVEVSMGRSVSGRDGFVSIWEARVVRREGLWHFVSARMRLIS